MRRVFRRPRRSQIIMRRNGRHVFIPVIRLGGWETFSTRPRSPAAPMQIIFCKIGSA